MTVLKFVDSIAASPTVRLDLNDGTTWKMRTFDAPPPRLRRAMGSNAMADGGFVSSSAYDMRMLFAGLNVRAATADATATQLQLLARELDRASNFLMYQAQGMTKPVFFVTSRSDFSALETVRAQPEMRLPSIDILAIPFALGVREDLVTAQDVTNDPASADGFEIAVNDASGDVMVPALVWAEDIAPGAQVMLAGSTRPAIVLQVESGTNGTDTAAVTADATYSNSAGKLTTFSTTTLSNRVTGLSTTPSAGIPAGKYRVLVRVLRNDAGSAFKMQLATADWTSELVTVPLDDSDFIMVDMGVYVAPGDKVGASSTELVHEDLTWTIKASGPSTTQLAYDYVALIPTDTTAMLTLPSTVASPHPVVCDGINDHTYSYTTSGTPFDGGQYNGGELGFGRDGSLPFVVPGDSYMYWVVLTAAPLTDTAAVSVSHWPGYLHVRPAGS